MYPAWAKHFPVFYHCKKMLILEELKALPSGCEQSKSGVKISWGPFAVVVSSLLSLCFDFTLWLIPRGPRQEPAVTRAHGRFCTLHPDTTDCQVGWKVTVVRVVSDTHWIGSIGDLNNSFLWIVRRLLSLLIAFTFHRVGIKRQLS